MNLDHANWYMDNGFNLIEGWCSPRMHKYCELINDFQDRNKVNGGVAEIGIHHGKFFILLNSFTSIKSKSYAVDVFEDQELNIDGSGNGSFYEFTRNLKKFDKHKGRNVKIINQDSTTLDINEISESVRMVSIDGGHTAEHTISDLKLAQSILEPKGVVIVDDITNPHWLGVIEGCINFLQLKPTLVPFAIGQNKLFFCNISYLKYYKSIFDNTGLVTKEDINLVGTKIVSLEP